MPFEDKDEPAFKKILKGVLETRTILLNAAEHRLERETYLGYFTWAYDTFNEMIRDNLDFLSSNNERGHYLDMMVEPDEGICEHSIEVTLFNAIVLTAVKGWGINFENDSFFGIVPQPLPINGLFPVPNLSKKTLTMKDLERIIKAAFPSDSKNAPYVSAAALKLLEYVIVYNSDFRLYNGQIEYDLATVRDKLDKLWTSRPSYMDKTLVLATGQTNTLKTEARKKTIEKLFLKGENRIKELTEKWFKELYEKGRKCVEYAETVNTIAELFKEKYGHNHKYTGRVSMGVSAFYERVKNRPYDQITEGEKERIREALEFLRFIVNKDFRRPFIYSNTYDGGREIYFEFGNAFRQDLPRFMWVNWRASQVLTDGKSHRYSTGFLAVIESMGLKCSNFMKTSKDTAYRADSKELMKLTTWEPDYFYKHIEELIKDLEKGDYITSYETIILTNNKPTIYVFYRNPKAFLEQPQ